MENNKTKRTTNRAQFEKLVECMKQHPDIAKNLTKSSAEVVREIWQNLRDELNSLGPPIKETAEWKKVWSDHKSSLRKKLVHNKRELKSTGGGSNTQVVFTPLEEEVISLICLRDGVEGLANSQKFGVPRKRTYTDSNSILMPTPPLSEEINPSEDIPEGEQEIVIETPTVVSQSRQPKSLKLLEKQIAIQQKLSDNIETYMKNQKQLSEEANLNQKKVYRAIDRLSDRQKQTNDILHDQLMENKRHNERMEELALEKNKIKRQILEIEIKKTEIDI